jgi:hypothetical protein
MVTSSIPAAPLLFLTALNASYTVFLTLPFLHQVREGDLYRGMHHPYAFLLVFATHGLWLLPKPPIIIIFGFFVFGKLEQGQISEFHI